MSAHPAPLPVPDTVAFLAGTWHVERELRDRRASVTGRFTGDTVVRAADDGKWWETENGVLEWQGARHEARRAHRLVPGGDGTAEVLFEDGRPFHPLDLRDGRWRAVHDCRPDRYEGVFLVVSPDEWRLTWEVRGPAKDLSLSSVYRRARPRARTAD